MIYNKEMTGKLVEQDMYNKRKMLIEKNVEKIYISKVICCCCGCRVENEEVLRISIYYNIDGFDYIDHYDYYCNNCCKTIDDLIDKCKTSNYLLYSSDDALKMILFSAILTCIGTITAFLLATIAV